MFLSIPPYSTIGMEISRMFLSFHFIPLPQWKKVENHFLPFLVMFHVKNHRILYFRLSPQLVVEKRGKKQIMYPFR